MRDADAAQRTVYLHGFGFWVESDELIEVDRSVSITVERVQQRFYLT